MPYLNRKARVVTQGGSKGEHTNYVEERSAKNIRVIIYSSTFDLSINICIGEDPRITNISSRQRMNR